MPATLHGYRRYRLKERDYPGVTSSVEDKVEGKLVFNLDSSAIQKLDDFEGSEYARKVIRAIGADGETYSASVYIFLETHLLEKDAGEWRLDEFITHKIHNWIADELGDQQGLGGRFWDAQQVPIT